MFVKNKEVDCPYQPIKFEVIMQPNICWSTGPKLKSLNELACLS